MTITKQDEEHHKTYLVYQTWKTSHATTNYHAHKTFSMSPMTFTECNQLFQEHENKVNFLAAIFDVNTQAP